MPLSTTTSSTCRSVRSCASGLTPIAHRSPRHSADVRFAFQGKTCLADWRQTNAQRLEAMHTHWGGAAFCAPAGSPAAQASNSASPAAGSNQHAGALGPVAAAARPDTARGPRPTRQPSRLSISSSGSLPTAAAAAAVASAAAASAMSPGSALGSLGRGGSGALLAISPAGSTGSSGQLTPGYIAADDSGALTARRAEPQGVQLRQLTMEQVVGEVRRSCPYSWGASLRVRVHLKLLG